MIRLKTERDIKYIKRAINIGEWVLRQILTELKLGMSTMEIDIRIEQLLQERGVTSSFKNYNGFLGNACISVNEEIIHGVPSGRELKEDDVVKINIGVKYKGYYSDQANTYIVSPARNMKNYTQVFATHIALMRAIKYAKEGNTLNDIAFEIERVADEFGLGILKDYSGHGVGFEVHEEPRAFNKVCFTNNVKLIKGMVIAIEPMYTSNKDGSYKRTKNGMVVVEGIGTHFERTVIIE